MPSVRDITLVLALGLGQVIAFASSFYLFAVLGDPITRSLHLSAGFVFTCLSGAFLLSAGLGPATGRWLDARGGREVLMTSSLVFATGLALVAAASQPFSLAAGVLVLGVGMSIGLYGTPYALLVQIHREAARPWITVVALLGGLGSSLGWLVTAALERHLGWRGACLVWAVLHLGVCLPLVAVLAPPGPARSPDHAPAPRGKIAWDRRMVQVAALFAGAWFVSTCIGAHLPRLLTRVGLTPQAAVGAAALLGVAAVSARMLELVVLRRLSPVRTARVAALMHPLGAVAMLGLGPRAAGVFVMAQGFGNGVFSVASGTLPLVLFGRQDYAYRTALLNTPARFAQAAGPALFALALNRSPQTALILTGGVCLVVCAMTFGLTPAERRA